MTETIDSPPRRDARHLGLLASQHGLTLMPSSTPGRFHLVRRQGNWTILAEVSLDAVDAFLTDVHGGSGNFF
jgi:hypothetical protein